MVNAAYRGEASRKGWTTEADLFDGLRTDEEDITMMLQKKNAIILKYCNDKHLITGCVYLEKNDTRLYLGMLTAAPLLQGSGIGRRLLDAAEKYAITNDCTYIEMTVISIRHELIQWYEKNNYYLTGETKPFPATIKFGRPKQPLEFITLRKDL